MLGFIAVVPLFAFLVWVAKSRSELIAEHRTLVRTLVRPLAGHWSVLQIAAVSTCARNCGGSFLPRCHPSEP
jgi:hypothetical protein